MASAGASATLTGRASARPRSRSLAGVLVAPATMVIVLAVALLLLMTPIWMHFALSASGGSFALATPEASSRLSDQTVAELFFGPGTFSAFPPDEAGHMRDVRMVLFGFLGLALGSAALVAWQLRGRRGDGDTWRSIARGGSALVVVLVGLGLFAALAFGIAFELFHRVLFPGGNWAFAPDSLLIQLYPLGFWQLSAGALGALGIVGGGLVWFLARRRARSLSAAQAE